MYREKRISEVLDAKAAYDKNIKASIAYSRLAALFDEGTFKTTGSYVKSSLGTYGQLENNDDYENVITGYGLIEGRLVFAYSQDFSKLDGAFGKQSAEKILALLDNAIKNGAPVISVLDSSGAKIEEGIEVLASYGKIIKKVCAMSGIVTQIAVVCGPCTGAMSLIAQAADYLIIEKEKGKLYLTPPSVVKTLLDKTSGNADDAVQNGIAAKICQGDKECIKSARELMSFLPSNNLEGTVYACESGDDFARLTDYISSIANADDADIKKVISDIADCGMYTEISDCYGEDIMCGFLSLAGSSVGFAACNIAENNGYTSVEACHKVARHLNCCDAFGIPFLTIVNSKGFDEVDNNAGAAVKLATAYACASVPCVTINLGKAYGSLFTVLGSKSIGADLAYALDISEISVLSPEKAVNFIWHDKIDGTKDPAKAREELYEQWSTKMASPLMAAYSGNIDDIISGDQVRAVLISAFEMLSSKSDIVPTKKHSNLPL